MSKRKRAAGILILLAAACLNFLIMNRQEEHATGSLNVKFELKTDISGEFQLFHNENREESFSEERKSVDSLKEGEDTCLDFSCPSSDLYLRLDFPDQEGQYKIFGISVQFHDFELEYPMSTMEFLASDGIKSLVFYQ